MFTGLVEEVGRVVRAEPTRNGRRLELEARTVLDGLAPGDSIAVEGVCLTVTDRAANGFSVEAIATTLERTTLGGLGPGDEVNLERALAFGARLGGHLVQGHVDATGRVVSLERQGEHVLLDVRMPEDVAEVTTLHGSIAINGVSLTVNALPQPDVVQVALIPHTWENTTLRRLRPGAAVNLEGDLIGRFVAHLLKRRSGGGV